MPLNQLIRKRILKQHPMKSSTNKISFLKKGWVVLLLAFLSVGMTAQNRADLQKAIEAHPDSLALHQAYLKTFKTQPSAVLDKQYAQWMKEFPNNATIPFALGEAYCHRELPEARPLLLEAVKRNPNLAKAYFYLWVDSDRWGDFDQSREYIKKASEIDPNNPDYAFYYANTWDQVNPQKYRKLSLAVAKRFPNSERGAQALYWLAHYTKNPSKKKEIYEMLKKDFPPQKFSWSRSGMSGYFAMLIKTNPEKATTLAQEMLKTAKGKYAIQFWKQAASSAQAVSSAQSLLAQQKPKEAVAALAKIKLSSRMRGYYNYILLLKAKALSEAGQKEEAYKTLLTSYAKTPDNEIGKALKKYGESLGKNWDAITKEIHDIRYADAPMATDFSLKNYFTGKKTSLADYRGKVILLTYWFPGCGPCRGEFPHFQNVVDQFKGKDLVYLAINIVPEQSPYVLPFVKASGYSFTPLLDVKGRDKGNLDNHKAAPMNFLIDRDGRLVFHRFSTGADNEQVLANMISALLQNK